MKTLSKPAARAKAARKVARRSTAPGIPGLSPVRTPPPAVGTVGDVLGMGADFGKGADWDVIATAHAARDL